MVAPGLSSKSTRGARVAGAAGGALVAVAEGAVAAGWGDALTGVNALAGPGVEAPGLAFAVLPGVAATTIASRLLLVRLLLLLPDTRWRETATGVAGEGCDEG